MNNKKEIISYVGEREIEFCVHFTNVTNLPSILQLGLLPKNTMDMLKSIKTERFLIFRLKVLLN